MGKRKLFPLIWVSFWYLVTVCALWLSSWWERESRLLYFECLSDVLWLFEFCGFHLDGEERAGCFTMSVLLVSCECLCSVAFILMGKRELFALLWVPFWCLVTVCILWLSSWWGRESRLLYFACLTDVLWQFVFCGFHLDWEERELGALLWVPFWCLVTVCILWLSSWWGRESRLLYFACLTDVLWQFVFCGFHLDWEERAACITLSVLLVSCDYLCSVAFILMGKRELLA